MNIASANYYPFGLVMDGKEITDEPYRYGYQGQFSEKDPKTGWNEFELRMYEPRIGRWVSPDPKGQFFSPYIGMGNAPHTYLDPNGGWAWSWVGAGIGAVAGGTVGYFASDGNLGWMAAGVVGGGLAGGLIGGIGGDGPHRATGWDRFRSDVFGEGSLSYDRNTWRSAPSRNNFTNFSKTGFVLNDKLIPPMIRGSYLNDIKLPNLFTPIRITIPRNLKIIQPALVSASSKYWKYNYNTFIQFYQSDPEGTVEYYSNQLNSRYKRRASNEGPGGSPKIIIKYKPQLADSKDFAERVRQKLIHLGVPAKGITLQGDKSLRYDTVFELD